MSKQRNRADEDADEFESEQEDVIVETEPRRLRARELMFSTSGRLALGAFGVLLLLGGAAALNQFLNHKTPLTAKKSNATEKADAAKATAKASAAAPEKEENPSSATVMPASNTRAGKYEPVDPSQFADFALPPESNTFDAAKDSAADAPAEVPTEFDRQMDAEDLLKQGAAAEADREVRPAAEVQPAAPSPAAMAPNPLRNTSPAAPIKPTREYLAREGESLFDIARYELKDAARWVEIYELNSAEIGDQFAALPAGVKLRIPQR